MRVCFRLRLAVWDYVCDRVAKKKKGKQYGISLAVLYRWCRPLRGSDDDDDDGRCRRKTAAQKNLPRRFSVRVCEDG